MKIAIIKNRRYFYLLSAIILVLGFTGLYLRGLNLGIDFSSGTVIELKFTDPIKTSEIREVMGNIDLTIEPVLRVIGDGKSIQVKTETLTAEKRQQFLQLIRQPYPNVEVTKTEQVDPIFGAELARQALIALGLAIILIVAYITWRFEFKFGIAAILALIHDVLVVLGVFTLLQIEINSSFVAAILLIVGYSINDTIVIFDRIRQSLKKQQNTNLAELVNSSLQQTMRRSIYTSVTTFLATGALLFLGGVTLKPFALALCLGIISGTYSSIFFASPIWLDWTLLGSQYSH